MRRGAEELELPLIDAVHTAQIHGAAFPERGLERKWFEQRVVGEDRAHLAAPFEIGFILLQELLDRFPARKGGALVIEHALPVVGEKRLLDADQPVAPLTPSTP